MTCQWLSTHVKKSNLYPNQTTLDLNMLI